MKTLFESLENRYLMSLPFGANYQDTSEFAIGSYTVNVVAINSNGSLDPKTETNWSATQINSIKNEIIEGENWWTNTFKAYHPTISSYSLTFLNDFTYLDIPMSSKYEPINRNYTDYSLWVSEFLQQQGINSYTNVQDGIDQYNNTKRIQNGTDWAYTVFVINSLADTDGKFKDGYFAYAYFNGPFLTLTYDNSGWGISRFGQVFSHESGHIFGALDEYKGSGSTYTMTAGYYNTQNINAYDGNPTPSLRTSSIMAEASLQTGSYTPNNVLPASTRAAIGWKDTDLDGIDDVLDVPHTLTGTINYQNGVISFSGSSNINTLQNLNPYTPKHNITLNKLDNLQYRINGNNWIDDLNLNKQTSTSINFSLPITGNFYLELRTIDKTTGVTSNIISYNNNSTPPIDPNPTPVETIPNPPSNLVLSILSGSKVKLTWQDNSSVETGFRIEKSTNGTSWAYVTNVGANRTSWNTSSSVTTLTYYRIKAYNSFGTSAASNIVNNGAFLTSATTSGAFPDIYNIPKIKLNIKLAEIKEL